MNRKKSSSRYIFVTLKGGHLYPSHEEALKRFKNSSAEYKGVYSASSENDSTIGINISGSIFSLAQEQLKKISKEVLKSGSFIADDRVLMVRTKNTGDDYIAAIITDDPSEESHDGIFPVVNRKDVISHYPLLDNLSWEKPDEFGTIKLDSDEYNYLISPSKMLILNGSRTIPSPYVSIEDEKGIYLDKEEVVQVLKSSVHRAVEVMEIAKSLGYDTKRTIALPRTEEVLLMDPDSFDIWKSYKISELGKNNNGKITSLLDNAEHSQPEALEISKPQ